LIDNVNGEEVLLTSPNDVKKKVMDHFQKCAGSINQEKHIPDNWKQEYEPITYINSNIYDELLSLPTMELLETHIKQLPVGKAAGPTGIHNEMIKHLPTNMKELLLDIIIDIFQNQHLPLDWSIANIYPIPKPKPWSCNLNNTCPITLLETARKLTVLILTTRLTHILKQNNVLNH
jgi:hypothetical protein